HRHGGAGAGGSLVGQRAARAHAGNQRGIAHRISKHLMQTEPGGLPQLELHAGHLRLEAVTKKFQNLAAVDDITLDIPRGSFTTLLGPSGCGKTTLLRTIAGFYEPDAGAIYLDARRI